MTMQATILHTAAMGLLLIAGCAGTKQMNDTAPAGDASRAWRLVQYGGPDQWAFPVTGTHVTIEIDLASGSISGTAGCNSFRGTVSHDGPLLTVGPLAMTKKMCIEPEGVMQQETALAHALQAVSGYSVAGDTLYLTYGSGQQIVLRGGAPDPGGDVDAATSSGLAGP